MSPFSLVFVAAVVIVLTFSVPVQSSIIQNVSCATSAKCRLVKVTRLR